MLADATQFVLEANASVDICGFKRFNNNIWADMNFFTGKSFDKDPLHVAIEGVWGVSESAFTVIYFLLV